jgi:predicted ATPase
MASVTVARVTEPDVPLLGRAEEQEVLAGVVRDARVGTSRVLTLVGEPGIGKTALLRWAAELARNEEMDVLSARGVESEAEVPFAGLLELLRPALDEGHRIPGAQADALTTALDLGPTRDRDQFLIGAATLNILSARSERAPLLVVADDAHWLDDSSLAALLFASRRLVVDPIAVLFAARPGEAPLLEAARLPALTLGGVDAESAAAIVRRHAPTPPAPGIVERLGRLTGGNPLALIELAATASDLEPGSGEHPIEVETSVAAAFGQRIAALPAATQRAMALAAAEGSGQLGWIGAAAADLGLALVDLEPAERADLIAMTYGTLTWRHPLARSAAYRAVPADDRRVIHAALARTAPDHEYDRRTWHRAAAVLGPDEDVAAALEGAARRARARGAYAAAATAAEAASRLTPEDRRRAGRLFMAAEAAWLAGNADRTLERLDEAEALVDDASLAAELAHLRGQVLVRAGDVMAAHDLLVRGAAAIEEIDRCLRVRRVAGKDDGAGPASVRAAPRGRRRA